VAGRARGGFARGRGNMVTRKAVVRPIFWRAPHFRRRSKTSATNCARRCSALRMKEVRCGRTCRGLHHRVTKTRAKSAGRTKMTRSLSNTIDVRRRTFGVRNGGDRKIRRCKCRANRVVRFSATCSGHPGFGLVARNVRFDSRIGETSLSIALRLWPARRAGSSGGEICSQWHRTASN